ncbi:hypothetical protein M9H77_35090 [Catharanthus roseus]|uniref:Uncharacterized protein n=1 Tax=Catharanthus roseus TaxID=4058 RepID=A0ACB9ZNA3_CATRO|nr:hypothetical protein M9H77_35090 [Catharanthus roseus]
MSVQILIHFMKVDTKEGNKLEVEEEEVYEKEDIIDHKNSEDLNGLIERSEDDCQEGIVDKEESSEDQEIISFEAGEEGMSLVTIRASMVVFIEEALKNTHEDFEDQGKASKLFSIYTVRKDHSRQQIRCENG